MKRTRPNLAIEPIGFMRHMAHLSMLCLNSIRRSQLTRMAAALSYRTIFGLIPVIVVGLVFAATFASREKVGEWLGAILHFAGLDQIAIDTTPIVHSADFVGPIDPTAEAIGQTTHGRLNEWIESIFNNIRSIRWGTIGFFGLATLIYAAISMLVEIEEAFNQIYNAPLGRSWARRVTQYWTLLTLGTLFLVGSFSLPNIIEEQVTNLQQRVSQVTATIFKPGAKGAATVPKDGPATTRENDAQAAEIGAAAQTAVQPSAQAEAEFAAAQLATADAGPLGDATMSAAPKSKLAPSATWVGKLLATSFSLIVSFVLFVVIYCVVPNTRVQVGPASVGAGFAAVLWELGKQAFAIYLHSSKGYANLYGALALLPLFLVWVYLTWIIVLFGLHVAHAMQSYRAAARQGLTQSVLVAMGLLVEKHSGNKPIRTIDPNAMVMLLAAIGERFESGKVSDQSQLADATGIDEPVVVQLLDRLQRAGFVHRTASGDQDEAGFVLAKPPQNVVISEVLTLAQDPATNIKSASGRHLLEEMSRSRMQSVAGKTLADVILHEAGSSPEQVAEAEGECLRAVERQPDGPMQRATEGPAERPGSKPSTIAPRPAT